MLVIVFHNRVTCSFTASLNGARTSSILPSIFCPSVVSSHALLFFFFHKQPDRESALIGGEPHRRMGLDRTLGTAQTVAICVPVLRRSADVALRRDSMDREEEQPHRGTEWWNPQKWVSDGGASVRYFRHLFLEWSWVETDRFVTISILQRLSVTLDIVQKKKIK